MAEPVCGTANRFDPKRVPKPLRYPERTSFEEDTVCVLPVLPRVENALEPRQTVSVSSAGVKHGQHHLNSATGWTSSPVSTCCGMRFGPDSLLANYTGGKIADRHAPTLQKSRLRNSHNGLFAFGVRYMQRKHENPIPGS